VATPFPTTRASGSTRLFPYSVAATLVAVGLPFAAVILLNHFTGFQGVAPLVLAVVALLSAVLASALGTALWMQHPASNEVAFGDLMIWSWARSAQARRQLIHSFQELTNEDEVISPHDRLITLRQMSAALDRKDPYTYGHSRRVERLAYRTGLALELSSRELQDLREAAAIHDVGKMFVPDRILLKEGALSSEEYEVIKEHPVKGADMVAFLDRPEVTETVRFHHERWDGKGYPDGVAGEDIPLLARIVGTVDAYDAMTSTRSYRGSLGHKRALEILNEEKGKQFDAAIVDAFIPTLRSPILAAITVPLLTGPIEALRRFFNWVDRSGRLDVATAAGAVGMSFVITVPFALNLGPTPRRARPEARPQVKVMGERVAWDHKLAAAEKASPSNEPANEERANKNGKKNEDKGKAHGKKATKKNKSRQNPGRPAAPGASSSDGSGSPGDSGGSAGAVADAADAAHEAAKGHEFDPPVPGDPKRAEGSDCPANGDSVGAELHCG
jgi:hypothetical protein